ncbi:MAG: sensor domain-containing diguanylate cyclase, partial [Rubrobacter sp.]|nr:sensor domain-containing diguanylate cyclase [Rubrobacter sp.]
MARRVSWRFRRGPAKRRQTEKTGLGERDRCALRERITERIPAVTYVLEVGEPSDTVYCSPQVEAMLGYPPEVFEKDRTHWIKVLHPDDRERILAEDARAGSTGEPFDAEYRCVARDGRTVWVHDKAVVTRDQEGLARFREGIMVDVTRRKVFEKQLEHLAFHDPLTDLPNRTLFMDRLRHALTRTDRRGKAVAVLFVDLDGFKRVNDSLGHYAGDRLLIAIANKLRACVRPEDTVARLSGDEFAMLLEDVTGAKDATLVAERLVDQLRTPFALEGREVYAGASVGISLGTSAEDRPGDLLRNADLALYEAKRRGKGRYEMFDGAARDRQAPEEDL